jgi:cytosine/adenosine deaminase-related metal-dependent hydrolase
MHWGAAVMDFSFVGELGLINTHVHTSQQLARGIADDVDLLTWLHGRIWPYESTMTDEDSYVSTLLCGVELIHSGVRHSDVFSMLGYHVASLENVSSDGMLWGCR